MNPENDLADKGNADHATKRHHKSWDHPRHRPTVRVVPTLMAKAFILFSLSTTLFAQDAASPRDQRPIKQLLSYLEADGEADGDTTLRWLTATRLLFTARKSVPFGSKPTPKYEWVDGLMQVNGAECCEVLHFDVETGKTSHHLDGILAGVIDDRGLKFDGKDVLSIGQKSLGNPNRAEERERAYGQGMHGPFGEEKPYANRPSGEPKKAKIGRCAGNIGKGWESFLRPEDGCLLGPPSDAQGETPTTYFRADGTQLQIQVGHIIRTVPHWFAWLDAYLLNDTTARLNGKRQTFPLMKPDGRLLTIPVVSRWTPTYARPTRAGMVGTINLDGGSSSYSGIFLQREGKVLQLVEGYVRHGVSVSPDGCHVAYVAEFYSPFSFAVSHRNTRVINVCTGLGIAPTDNPFQW